MITEEGVAFAPSRTPQVPFHALEESRAPVCCCRLQERRRMGNCQAPEAVVIQHPGGREEQLYWPMSAADVMKSNPGYHVALVTLCVSEQRGDGGGGVVRLTRVRLLKPKDVLLLGQVYRLVTSQEVTLALRARTQEKLNKCQQHRTNDQVDYLLFFAEFGFDGAGVLNALCVHVVRQVAKQQRDRQRSGPQMAARARQWRPSLQSIAEAAS
ncbi:hypothetical protein MUK42_19779 [Musa troglodytarum]|uniref:Uncharacterized protein n=1 Tax=Musa troglodytarum TaxID=320322 RepID=A0A9E7K3K1_9LILI|nr:hypothetical protein MUK42_19779 [Musa troglodytarum]